MSSTPRAQPAPVRLPHLTAMHDIIALRTASHPHPHPFVRSTVATQGLDDHGPAGRRRQVWRQRWQRRVGAVGAGGRACCIPGG